MENIVHDSFAFFGFDEINRLREANLEDWVIEFHNPDSKYKYGIIEVHGTENRTTETKLTKCNKWVDEYFEKDGTLVKGIFIPNQHRLEDYEISKTKRMHFEPRELEYANSKSICVIPSSVLFEEVINSLNGNKKTRNKFEQLILDTNGLLKSFNEKN